MAIKCSRTAALAGYVWKIHNDFNSFALNNLMCLLKIFKWYILKFKIWKRSFYLSVQKPHRYDTMISYITAQNWGGKTHGNSLSINSCIVSIWCYFPSMGLINIIHDRRCFPSAIQNQILLTLTLILILTTTIIRVPADGK